MKRGRGEVGVGEQGKRPKEDEPKLDRKIIVSAPDYIETTMCPICKDPAAVLEDYAEGNMVCQKCGRVIGDRVISADSEWRTFADGDSKRDDPNRVGGPESELLKEFGLSTRIGTDNSGLARVHNQEALEAQQRALLDEFTELRKLIERCGMPDGISQRAQVLYKGLKLSPEMRGAKKPILSGVCVFIAGREKNVPRPLKEIAQHQGQDKRDFSRLYNKIRKLSKTDKDIKALVKNTGAYKHNEKEMIARFCSELGLKMPVATAAREILQRIHKSGELAGRQPTTLAGVALYLAGRKFAIPIELDRIAGVVGNSAPTIQSAASKLDRIMNQILEDPAEQRAPAVVAAPTTPVEPHALPLTQPQEDIYGGFREFL